MVDSCGLEYFVFILLMLGDGVIGLVSADDGTDDDFEDGVDDGTDDGTDDGVNGATEEVADDAAAVDEGASVSAQGPLLTSGHGRHGGLVPAALFLRLADGGTQRGPGDATYDSTADGVEGVTGGDTDDASAVEEEASISAHGPLLTSGSGRNGGLIPAALFLRLVSGWLSETLHLPTMKSALGRGFFIHATSAG